MESDADYNSTIKNEYEPIKTKEEFEFILNRYLQLNGLKKEKRFLAYNEISNLKYRLLIGIPISNKNIIIQKAILSIIEFLKFYNFDTDIFESTLHNTKFTISSIKDICSSKGLAMASGEKVFLDISIVEFNEDGFFKCVKSDDVDLYIHILIHELFHRISAYRDDKKHIYANESALSEGFTDLFAETISNYHGPRKSKTYQFSKDVCNILTSLIGYRESLDDYLNNLIEFPKLKALFSKYNINFDEFNRKFDRLLEMRYNEANEDAIIALENEFLIELKSKLIEPYINDNPDKKEEIINKFNFLFEDRNILFDNSKRR